MSRSASIRQSQSGFGPMRSQGPFLARACVLGASLIVLCASIAFPSDATSTAAMVSSTALCAYLLVAARKNWLLAIPFAFMLYCVYSVLMVQYLGMLKEYSPYTLFCGTAYAWEGASIVLAFLTCIAMVLPLDVRPFPTMRIVSDRGNGTIVAACLVVVVLFGAIAQSSSSGTGRMVVSSSLYEYSIAFLLVALYFTGGDKRYISAIIFGLLYRIYLDLSTGNRITSLEMVAMVFIMLISYRTRYRVAIPLCAAALLVLLGVGALRGGEFSLERIADYLSKTFESGLAWDGAYSAYHTSLAVLATEGLRSSAERLSEFPTYLATVSVWPFDVSGFLDPVREARVVYYHNAGCYFPFYFHYYLGMWGVVPFSVLVGCALRALALIPEREGALLAVGCIAAVWISATCFRWFQYEPTSLLRGVAIVFILSAIASAYSRSNQPKSKKDEGLRECQMQHR